MHITQDKIQRFVVLAGIYSRLSGKSGLKISGEQMEGLYTLVMQSASPDRFYKLIEFTNKIQKSATSGQEHIQANALQILPPEQRVV
jgi:hypothetical protein